MAVKIRVMVFWVVMLCSDVLGYHIYPFYSPHAHSPTAILLIEACWLPSYTSNNDHHGKDCPSSAIHFSMEHPHFHLTQLYCIL